MERSDPFCLSPEAAARLLAGQLDQVRAFGPGLLHVSCGANDNARADLLSADGVHFSSAGQAVLAAELVKALARVPA